MWIDIVDGGVTKGPVVTATGWESTSCLNRAGSISFTMPLADPKAAIVVDKAIARCKVWENEAERELGVGVIDRVDFDVSEPTITFSGDDLGVELTYDHVGILVTGTEPSPTHTAPADIIAFAPMGWTLDTVNGRDTTLKAISHQFKNETVLDAFIRMTEISGDSFYLDTVNRKVVWLWSTDVPNSGIRAISSQGASAALWSNDLVCLIQSLTKSSDAYDSKVGRLYLTGAGIGGAEITLDGSTVVLPSGYVIGNAVGKGYYLEHTATWSAYGIARTDTAKDIQGTNELTEAALEWLKVHLAANVSYDMQVAKLATAVHPGQTIHVEYQSWHGSYCEVNINADLTILSVTTTVDENGIMVTAMQLATVDRWPDTDQSSVATSIIKAQKLANHTQPLKAADIIGTVTPSVHAPTHKAGGADAIKLDELAAPTDVETLNATTSLHGLLKKLSNVSTEFMNGLGNWATPAFVGGSGTAGRIPAWATPSTLGDTFLASTVSGFTATFAGAMGAARVFTLPDASVTLAGLQTPQTFTKAQTVNPDSDVIALTLKMAAAATANPLEVKNSGGTNLMYVNASGGGYFAANTGFGASPSATARINSYYQPSATGDVFNLNFEIRSAIPPPIGQAIHGVGGIAYCYGAMYDVVGFRGQVLFANTTLYTQPQMEVYLGWIGNFNTGGATLTKGYVYRAKDVQVNSGANGVVATQVAFGADDLTGAIINKFMEGKKGVSTLGDQLKITGWQDIVQFISQSNGTQTTDNSQFGNVSGGNYSAFEGNGIYRATGTATTYEDIFMPIVPKDTGTGKPTLRAFTGNIRKYTMAVDDVADIDTSELLHKWTEGSLIEIHVHWATRTLNDATVRGVKWEIDYTWANAEHSGGTIVFGAATTVSVESSIAANEADKTHKYTSVLTFTPSGGKIGAAFNCSLKRIASVTNVAPADDPWIMMVGAHINQDTFGSRTTSAK